MIEHSFRDPSGQLYHIDERILRIVNEYGREDFLAYLSSKVVQGFVSEKKMIPSTVIANSKFLPFKVDENSIVVEHQRISFPSYPYEWSPGMLYAAGTLTLDIACALLKDGLGLKDATPYNVLFQGPDPIFIDILSVERRNRHDAMWLPYAQFMRTVVLPLLVNKHFAWSLADIFLTRRDGIEPEDVYQLSSFVQRICTPFLGAVSIPVWLTRRRQGGNAGIYKEKLHVNADKANFIIESQMKGLKGSLCKVKPKEHRKSVWSGYMQGNNNYSSDQMNEKLRFVAASLDKCQPTTVLDIGCNTGYFSVMAAQQGASVIALDYDAAVVDTLWRQAVRERLDILPLVVNLTRPSPALGWRNRECSSFLERARGKFSMVLMLAVIHHMLVTERIPLSEILLLATELTNEYVIIEYVDPADSMFQCLTRGREALFSYLTEEYFKSECEKRFNIVTALPLAGEKRALYLLKKKDV